MAKKVSDEKAAIRSRNWEIFDYSLFGTIWVAGVTLGALGIFARNTETISDNPIYEAEVSMTKWLGWSIGTIDWRIFGLLVMIIGLIGLLITFNYFANKVEKEKAAEARRAERLKSILADESKVKDEISSVK